MKLLIVATIIMCILSFSFVSSARAQSSSVESLQRQVSFVTEDKVVITGTLYFPQASASGVSPQHVPATILLHMLGRDRNDWNNFAQELQESGFVVLTFDFRGHGQSAEQAGGALSYASFTADDFNKMVLDVKAAKQFLLNLGNTSGSENATPVVDPANIILIGASIGANVAVNYAASDHSIKSIVLLSPGIDYRGVRTDDAIKKISSSTFILATSDDSIAGSDPLKLCQSINQSSNSSCSAATFHLYQGSSSHGTNMLSDSTLQPPPASLIISWLQSTVVPEFPSTEPLLTASAVAAVLLLVNTRIRKRLH